MPEALRRVFVTALEPAPKQHLRVQQAFQRHVDNAVSKTVNLAGDASAAVVAEVYRDAWRLGLKGIGVDRYGAKAPQVLTLGVAEEPSARESFIECDPGACRLSGGPGGRVARRMGRRNRPAGPHLRGPRGRSRAVATGERRERR
jgi:ribonucleotide reductase alpha subunit